MSDETLQFVPFHAINEFMQSEYRNRVIRAALNYQPRLPGEQRAQIDRLVRQNVQVPGFRNSAKAPVQLKVKPVAEAFEKNPELAALLLSAWAQAQPELRQKMYDLLTGYGWDILPPEADRTQLPGFLPTWPAGHDFDAIYEDFRAHYPDTPMEKDDTSLMAVWLTGRLPFETEEEEEEGEEGEGE